MLKFSVSKGTPHYPHTSTHTPSPPKNWYQSVLNDTWTGGIKVPRSGLEMSATQICDVSTSIWIRIFAKQYMGSVILTVLCILFISPSHIYHLLKSCGCAQKWLRRTPNGWCECPVVDAVVEVQQRWRVPTPVRCMVSCGHPGVPFSSECCNVPAAGTRESWIRMTSAMTALHKSRGIHNINSNSSVLLVKNRATKSLISLRDTRQHSTYQCTLHALPNLCKQMRQSIYDAADITKAFTRTPPFVRSLPFLSYSVQCPRRV